MYGLSSSSAAAFQQPAVVDGLQPSNMIHGPLTADDVRRLFSESAVELDVASAKYLRAMKLFSSRVEADADADADAEQLRLYTARWVHLRRTLAAHESKSPGWPRT
jgi:hypothetical protein